MSIKQDKTRIIFILVSFSLFFYFAIFCPIGIYNDTAQYIAMHIHRDPLYCLFLWLLRLGRDTDSTSYMKAAVYIQNLLAWLSVLSLTETVNEQFFTRKSKFSFISHSLVYIFALAPHIFTPLSAQSGLILSNSIMSEAITIPLFYFFISEMLRMMNDEKKLNIYTWTSLSLAWLLALARGQMMVLLIVWIIVMSVRLCSKKTWLQLLLALSLGAAAFGFRSLTVNTYNMVFNNYYMKTTFSEVSFLANVLYASDRDDLQYIEDDEARRFAEESMTMVFDNEYHYSFSKPGLLARGLDLEAKHDPIKFKCIDECWRPIHDVESDILKNDYELETAEQDRIAGIIIKDLLPHCLGVWLYDYIALCIYGFVRCVSIATPVFMIWALFVYLFILIYTIILIRKDLTKYRKLIRLSLFTCLLVCANVCGTATVIMCLSRYMIYVFPLIYILLLALIDNLIKEKL